MHRWRIVDGPNPVAVDPHDDFELWSATVESLATPPQRRTATIEIARTARQSVHTLLSGDLTTDVRTAVETNGRAALERFLGNDQPPARIVVSATGIVAPCEPS